MINYIDFLPRDALLCKARSCDRMSSVCLSVYPSVTLVDHTQLNSTGNYGRRCKHLYVRIIMFIFLKKRHY